MYGRKGVVHVAKTNAESAVLPGKKIGYWKKLKLDFLKNPWLYLMLIPGLIYFLVFKYLPMHGRDSTGSSASSPPVNG